MFFLSRKTVFKQSRQLLDTSSTPSYLSSFSTSSYRNLDSFSTARWIDQDFFWILDSFSTAGGSIELFFSFLLICPSTDPRQLHLSTPFLLYTWLDTCLDTSRHLYLSSFTDLLYKGLAWSDSHFSQSPSRQIHLFTSQTSLSHSKLLPQGFFKLVQVFLHLVSFESLIYMHFMFWNLGFGVFQNWSDFVEILG